MNPVNAIKFTDTARVARYENICSYLLNDCLNGTRPLTEAELASAWKHSETKTIDQLLERADHDRHERRECE